MVEESPGGVDDSKIQWDLRVTRTQIIGRRWFAIELHKDSKNYIKWFESLHLLASTIKHAVKTKELDKYVQDYKELYKDLVEVTNKYKEDYYKKTSTSAGVFEIQEALLNLEEFLERTMKESGILGDKEDVRGL